jgi:hypothetical protein
VGAEALVRGSGTQASRLSVGFEWTTADCPVAKRYARLAASGDRGKAWTQLEEDTPQTIDQQFQREAERARRAKEREARALEHQHEAERQAANAPTPEAAELHRAEARVHARAAKLHRQAAELQSEHLDEQQP